MREGVGGLVEGFQDSLRLFVNLVAIACICMGVAGFVGYFRLGEIGGQALLASPRFSTVVILCGVGLFAARADLRHARWWASGVMLLVLLARVAPLQSDAWLNGRTASIDTATLIIMLGAAAALLLRHGIKQSGTDARRNTFAVAVLSVSMSTFAAYVLIETDISRHQRFAHAAAEAVARKVTIEINKTEGLLQRLGARWDSIDHVPRQAFIQQEFEGYMQDFPHFQSFAVVDRDRTVIWESRPGEEPLGWAGSLVANRGMQEWIEHVHESGEAHFGTHVDAAWAEKWALVVTPLSNPHMSGWSVVACVDFAAIFAAASSAEVGGMGHFRLTHGDRALYRTPAEFPARAFAAGEIDMPVHHDFGLTLSYVYADPFVAEGAEIMPEFVLLAGMLFSFFMVSAQQFAHVARQRAVQLSHSALHDPLTGLANRRLLEKQLIQACARARSEGQFVSVVFFDLDGIKLINDSLGHDIGDMLLIDVADRLRRGTKFDDSVTRLGGYEFVLLVYGASASQVQTRVQRAIARLSKPYDIAGRVLRVTTNAGIATSDGHVQDPMQLVREADLAMLTAKKAGRNTWQEYTPDMGASVADRLELSNDLQTALDNDALELYYQPIWDLRTGAVAGVEALLRWPHPTQGYISPAKMIPIAEETGQIMPLTDWVLNRACRDSGVMRKRGLPAFPVIVNISPVYFQRSAFVGNLQAALHAAALPAEFLEIEITEGVFLDDAKMAAAKLMELRALGVGSSIDDFGTGFSSLSYLKNLPIDKVKIDRSFVMDVVNDPADAAIVQGIVSMAHHLGLKVVAEGVETEAQYAFLKGCQCDQFQGFLYARPMRFEALVDKLLKV